MCLENMCDIQMSKWRLWSGYTMNVPNQALYAASSSSRIVLSLPTLSQSRSKSGFKIEGLCCISSHDLNCVHEIMPSFWRSHFCSHGNMLVCRCREKQRKESSRLVTVNAKLTALNKLLMEENERLSKHSSQLTLDNHLLRQELQQMPATPGKRKLPDQVSESRLWIMGIHLSWG